MRRYTSSVEEYSIDECFADLGELPEYDSIAWQIKKDLEISLNMTFSIGIAPTKVVAKAASKWKKPAGLTIIEEFERAEFLEKIPANKIWGIGPSASQKLRKLGLVTAKEFIDKSEEWVSLHFGKPMLEIWHELSGRSIFKVNTGSREQYKSFMKSRTFNPPTNDKEKIFSELSFNIERVCVRLRAHSLYAGTIHPYIKTQTFHYKSLDIRLPHKTNMPYDILSVVKDHLSEIWKPGVLYRATGITVHNLSAEKAWQGDLFGSAEKSKSIGELFQTIDQLNAKHHKSNSVFLASSFKAYGILPKQKRGKMKPVKKVINIPLLGNAN